MASVSPDKPEPAARTRVAITNVRVFDGEALTEPRTVVITEDGLIGSSASGADGATAVDGEGGVLIPGLIDAHVHLHGDDNLEQLARHGVTTALDMACWPPERVQSFRGRVGLTDVRSAGLPATSAGSLHSELFPLPKAELLTGPAQAEAWVDARIAEGSDYIKLIAAVPGPSEDVLAALAAAAHARGKLVVAHTAADVSFQQALVAGADVLTHVPTDKAVDEAAARRMVAEGRIAVPTLTMMEQTSKPPALATVAGLLLKPRLFVAIVRTQRSSPHPRSKDPFANAKESVRCMHAAGVPILAGTDCHDTSDSPYSVPHGASMHRELEFLVESGLSNLEALQAATSLPAKHFGLHDRGAVEEGKRADLVLLAADPLEDIKATRKIKRIWCHGIEHEVA